VNDLNLSKLIFTKKDLLAAASEEEVVFIILAGALLQEATFLHKLIIFSIQKTDQTEESRAAVAQSMFLLRYLGAHLFEGWETLRKDSYKAINAKLDARLSVAGRETLQKLQDYFAKSNNRCERLRNDYAYHRNSGQIRSSFQQIKDGEVLDVLIHDSYANCRFTAFEMVLGLATLGTAELPKMQGALDALIDEVLDIAKLFMGLISEYIVIFFGQIKNLSREEVKLIGVPLLGDVWLPYFVLRAESVHPSTSSG
jgi:hypothetical protein